MPNHPILLLRLEGPLQAWGLRARWDVRDTGDEPSKSGIIGLLGCALGYPMADSHLEELDQALTLGVRVEHPGSVLQDYQTITGILPRADGGSKGTATDPSTIISPRVYLADAAFLAAIAGPPARLEACHAALLAPRWPVYLGRKSCLPTRPVLEALSDRYANLEDALQHHPWDWGGKHTLDAYPTDLRCALEDPAGEAERPDRVRTDPARMYGVRRVRIFLVPFPGPKEER